jgi:conjugative transposon TraN protein
MKRVVLLGVLCYTLQMQAQVVEDLKLFVCYDKTVNIIFPYAILSEDHGSSGIIVQQRKGANHILHVKANQKNFSPTSVSVVTSDGSLYSFVVQYADDVYQLNYVIDTADAVVVTEVPHNESILEEESERVSVLRGNVRKSVRDDYSVLSLRGLYTSSSALWLKINFTNRTVIPFRVGFIKFFIRDKRRTRNSAVREKEIAPIYQEAPDVFEGKRGEPLLFTFDPFVINKGQQLIMQVGESTGKRLIQLRIRPKHFKRTGVLQ